MKSKKLKIIVVCPYCNQNAIMVKGNIIYPHRKDLNHLNFYLCFQCDARVGTHKGTDKPLGRLANAELRKMKSKTHLFFDLIWKSKKQTRKQAYIWLAKKLGIDIRDCHIGMFDVHTCQKVIDICNE